MRKILLLVSCLGLSFAAYAQTATRAKLRKGAELAAVTFEARPCSVSNKLKLEWKK